MVGGEGDPCPLLPEILGQPAPVGVKSMIQSIFVCSASAVTPSEKSSINTNRSPPRAFQWA